MFEGNETATHAFWESIEHAAEELMHMVDPRHEIQLIPNFGAGEIAAIVATSAHAVAAVHAAATGDWEGASNHSADMAFSAYSASLEGVPGYVASAYDAAAAVLRAQGHEAPTFSDILHSKVHEFGGAAGDFVYFATHPDARPGSGAGPAGHASQVHEAVASPAGSHTGPQESPADRNDGGPPFDATPPGGAGPASPGDSADPAAANQGGDASQGQAAIGPNGVKPDESPASPHHAAPAHPESSGQERGGQEHGGHHEHSHHDAGRHHSGHHDAGHHQSGHHDVGYHGSTAAGFGAGPDASAAGGLGLQHDGAALGGFGLEHDASAAGVIGPDHDGSAGSFGLDQDPPAAGGYGLEPDGSLVGGFGLDQDPPAAGGYGLEPDGSLVGGFGLDQDPSAAGGYGLDEDASAVGGYDVGWIGSDHYEFDGGTTGGYAGTGGDFFDMVDGTF